MASTQDFFGSSATNTGSVLTVNRSDFSTFDNPSDKGERWFTAILENIRQFSENATDEEANVVVSNPFNGLVTRTQGGNQVNQRSYSYTVTVYVNDLSPTIPDPDQI